MGTKWSGVEHENGKTTEFTFQDVKIDPTNSTPRKIQGQGQDAFGKFGFHGEIMDRRVKFIKQYKKNQRKPKYYRAFWNENTKIMSGFSSFKQNQSDDAFQCFQK